MRLTHATLVWFVFVFCATGLLAQMGGSGVASRMPYFKTLHSFDGTDGVYSSAALVQATDGNLYGTTANGGANGDGTIFRITPSGTLTTIYSFCSQPGCADGLEPYGVLIQATTGDLYGTTSHGGTANSGTVFRITPSGTLTTLYTFCSQSNCVDGANPYGGLVQAIDGNLYGTTSHGGTLGVGTVFKITPSGTLTMLYSFCSQNNCMDGIQPYAALVQATDGNFYGTTFYGGDAFFYDGTVFKITPNGTLTTLHAFCSEQTGCPDGANPYGALIQATDGDLYGTTSLGGANYSGAVFKITPSGTLTTLYSFCAQQGCPDGLQPSAALVQATDGNFYGTTDLVGTQNLGTVFKITPSGTLTTLHTFCSRHAGCQDGTNPYGGLVQATSGILYGTTSTGGANGDGTVFGLSAGLAPFVETQPTAARVGATVNILGTNLTGATSVSFNGTAATFTVVSSSEITTTVPAGATTGKVHVVTPNRTLSSNVPFRVLP